MSECQNLNIRASALSDETKLPSYAKYGDGACDLFGAVDAVLKPHQRKLIPTGLKLEIPFGYGGLVLPRSGLAINHGITCLNAPGLIDSGYRGEVKVILYNSDPEVEFHVKVGDRVAQLVVIALPQLKFSLVAELSDSERGSGGFGHTGI